MRVLRSIMATATRPSVCVDVISDTVCPWCFVGKKHLETAIGRLSKEIDVAVSWHPYQLNPAAIKENKLAMYNRKFGAERVKTMIPMMQLGFTYSISGDTGNTFDSHRLIAWAGTVHGTTAQSALVEAMFKAYMCDEQCIQDHSVLLQAAVDAGLPAADAERVVSDSDAYAREVRADTQRFARVVAGVPHFIISGRVHLTGAQPPEQLERALRQASTQENGQI